MTEIVDIEDFETLDSDSDDVVNFEAFSSDSDYEEDSI